MYKAASVNGIKFKPSPCTNYKVTVIYTITAATSIKIASINGIYITTEIFYIFPISRNTFKLVFNKATDNAIIDPRYFANKHDRFVIRAGIRLALKAIESTAIRYTPLPGIPRINSALSDKKLDARVESTSWAWFHPAGTVSMGKIVDSKYRVYNVDRFRIINTSIIPLSITVYL